MRNITRLFGRLEQSFVYGAPLDSPPGERRREMSCQTQKNVKSFVFSELYTAFLRGYSRTRLGSKYYTIYIDLLMVFLAGGQKPKNKWSINSRKMSMHFLIVLFARPENNKNFICHLVLPDIVLLYITLFPRKKMFGNIQFHP